jgi:PAS domain S-box-containing protein
LLTKYNKYKTQVTRLQGLAVQPPAPENFAETLEALSNALEELQVTQEELRQQNEELTAARQDAEAQKQRYGELFQSAPEAYLVSDANGKVEEANRAAAALLGVSTAVLVGKPIFSFIAAEDRRPLRQSVLRLVQDGGPAAGNRIDALALRLRPRQLSQIDAEATVEAARDARGASIALRWFLRDVRTRRQAEAERLRLERDASPLPDRSPTTKAVQPSAMGKQS